MSDPDPTPRMAYEILRGHVVKWPGAPDPETVFIKAERQGTDYIHHYLIQISPQQADLTAMVYVDPEEMLVEVGGPPRFSYSGGEARDNPDIGHIFETAKGTFLKVIEDPKSQKMFAFIDIASGEVKRRQERHVRTVYGSWQVTKIGEA